MKGARMGPIRKTRFEVGETYMVRSIGDYDCQYVFTVTKRTAKTVTVEYFGESITRHIKISEWDENEYIMPFGTYSMAACLSSNGKVE
jgi:hypothetical protein